MNLRHVLSVLSRGNELCTSVELVTKLNLGRDPSVEHRVDVSVAPDWAHSGC